MPRPGLVRKIIGYTLIGLGIIGLFLPFLQGILLILAGVVVLGGKRAGERMKKKFHDWHQKWLTRKSR